MGPANEPLCPPAWRLNPGLPFFPVAVRHRTGSPVISNTWRRPLRRPISQVMGPECSPQPEAQSSAPSPFWALVMVRPGPLPGWAPGLPEGLPGHGDAGLPAFRHSCLVVRAPLPAASLQLSSSPGLCIPQRVQMLADVWDGTASPPNSCPPQPQHVTLLGNGVLAEVLS